MFCDLEPGGNAEYVTDHGLGLEDVEHVLRHPEKHAMSRSSGRPILFGYTPSGDYIAVVYEEIDEDTVYPATTYVLEE